MFSESKRQIASLEAQISALKERLYKVEASLEPFRVGDITCWYPGLPDRRPQVTHELAIRLLMDHLGLKFQELRGVPASVALTKREKVSSR